MIIDLVNNVPVFIVNFKQKHIVLISENTNTNTVIIGQSYLEYSAFSEKLDIKLKRNPLEIVSITNV
jgi:hypothetical protein